MKITVLLEYPDGAIPAEFSADMELHGGRVTVVQFSDLFQEMEALEPYLAHKLSCECMGDDDRDDPACDCGLSEINQANFDHGDHADRP